MANPTPPEESDTQGEKTWFDQQMEKFWFQAGLFVVVVALYILLGYILFRWLNDTYIKPTNATQKKDLMQALGLVMAGVAGAIGIYFTWRGQRLTQRAQEENQRNTQEQLRNAQEQLRNAQEELRLTREGQITERFTRAIDQLGTNSLEIRLGGIYALERIAKDSPERDYSTVIEVLAAYVRENAPAPEVDPASEPALNALSPPTDIQAILDVFRRLEGDRVQRQPEKLRAPLDLQIIDLRGANLRGANLTGAHLERAVFRDAHLQGAKFYVAHLEGADLIGAHLEEAKLDVVHLEGAYLTGSHLEGASLMYAHLEGADLISAHLEGAFLRVVTGLTQEQINVAYGDDKTDLPEGLERPAHWSKSSDEPPNREE